MSLVIQQSILHLTPSLFGNSYSFEILRFPGGITIIPPQTAFVPQKPDGLFNFSLNFPIDVVQDKLSELKAQMKSGLFLNGHEVCAAQVPVHLFKALLKNQFTCHDWRIFFKLFQLVNPNRFYLLMTILTLKLAVLLKYVVH